MYRTVRTGIEEWLLRIRGKRAVFVYPSASTRCSAAQTEKEVAIGASHKSQERAFHQRSPTRWKKDRLHQPVRPARKLDKDTYALDPDSPMPNRSESYTTHLTDRKRQSTRLIPFARKLAILLISTPQNTAQHPQSIVQPDSLRPTLRPHGPVPLLQAVRCRTEDAIRDALCRQPVLADPVDAVGEAVDLRLEHCCHVP